ncbi:MAG: hypothetical protein QNJ38_14805 [Prochloraceae cyanobacterium]|nr:hypothetical protein [Prochloraceae cyanobacterium]
MLVLSKKDIKYCQFSYESDSLQRTYRGISYQGVLLTQIASFTYKQYEQAVAICRECLQGDDLISFLIKEKDKITVWSEIGQVDSVVLAELKSTPSQDNDSKNQPKTLPQKNILKYRGREIVKPIKNATIISNQKLENRNKKLKYRGSSY